MKSFDLWKKESAKRRFFFRRVRSNPQDHKNEIKKDEKKDDQNKKKSKKKEEAHFDRTKKLPKIIIVSSRFKIYYIRHCRLLFSYLLTTEGQLPF